MEDIKVHTDFTEFHPPNLHLRDEYLIQELTEKFFGEDLQLAIIETTTISTVQSVGTSHYIARKSKEEVMSLHSDYESIIAQVKNLTLGGPSKHYDWYQRNEFPYVIGENKDLKHIDEEYEPNPLCSVIVIPPKPKADKYIQDYTTKVGKTEMERFMREYTKCFLRRKWFQELHYYFILVMPLSVKENKIGYFVPLGNLYIKIGTRSPINFGVCQKYVQCIKALWFKDYGAKVLKEYSDKRISTQHIPNIMVSKEKKHKTLAKLLEKEILRDKKEYEPISFEELFHYTFDFGGFRPIVEDRLMTSKHPLIGDLIRSDLRVCEIDKTIRLFYYNTADPENILTCTIDGLAKLKILNESSIAYFVQLLSKRRLALVLFLILRFSPEDVHGCIVSISKSNQKQENILRYLREQLYIYPDPIVSQDLISDNEKSFLNKIIDRMTNYKSKTFDTSKVRTSYF